MRSPSRIDWRRCAVQSLLFAAMQVVTFNASYFVFLSAQEERPVLESLAVMTSTRMAFAMLIAASAQWVEARWPWPAVAALCLLQCALINLQHDLYVFGREWLGLPTTFGPPRATFAWMSVVSGVPFFWYCLVVQRSVRVRNLLARAEFERARTAAQVGLAEADALEGRVDPALLQRALAALQTAYARDRAQAEEVLDALVDFLRQAMPAIRSGRTSLLDEMTLLRRYAALVSLVDGGRRLCSVSAQNPPHDLPFAPLLLIPLVEALAAANTDATVAPQVGLTVEDEVVRLAFDALHEVIVQPASGCPRIERALRGTPDAAGARYEVGGSRALTVWLPLPPAHEELCHEEELPAPT